MTVPVIAKNAVKLTSVTLPKDVTVIPDECFAKCSNLTSVNLDNITEIGASAFGYTLAVADLKQEGFLLRCFKDSAAHSYAEEYGIEYELIEREQPDGSSNDNDTNPRTGTAAGFAVLTIFAAALAVLGKRS